MDAFFWVMDWEGMISVSSLVGLLEKHFFPKWLQVGGPRGLAGIKSHRVPQAVGALKPLGLLVPQPCCRRWPFLPLFRSTSLAFELLGCQGQCGRAPKVSGLLPPPTGALFLAQQQPQL